MYELIQLTERTYYIKSPTNIGLFRLDEKNVCLIDSGNDKDAGRRIRQVLDANGWQTFFSSSRKRPMLVGLLM